MSAEGPLESSKACIKRIRVYSKNCPEKVIEVYLLLLSLSADADSL